MMRRVARAEALKLTESKRFAVLNENALANAPTGLSTQWAIKNVFSQLSAGTASFNIVGNEIQRPLLKLKFLFRADFGNLRSDNGANYGSVAFNVVLVASNDTSFAAGTATSFTNTSLLSGFDMFYQPDGFKPTFNGNNVKVLKTWHRVIHPDQAAGAIIGSQTVTGKMKYRWRRKLTYEDSSVVPGVGGPAREPLELRGWNYWLLVGTQVTTNYTSALTAPPVAIVDSFLYFKDP